MNFKFVLEQIYVAQWSYGTYTGYFVFKVQKYQGAFLLTWINFNPRKDK